MDGWIRERGTVVSAWVQRFGEGGAVELQPGMAGEAVLVAPDAEAQVGGIAPAPEKVEEDERAGIAEIPFVETKQQSLGKPNDALRIVVGAPSRTRCGVEQAGQPRQREPARR